MKKNDIDEEQVFFEMVELGSDILFSIPYQKLHSYTKHGKTSTFTHVVMVSFLSLLRAERKNKKIDKKSLVRGALLHDFYLYDWHDPSHPKLHGFRHAGIAFKKAKEYYEINDIEAQIIKRHMFPLTPLMPLKKVALIVCLQDKKCSLKETRKAHPYEKYESLLDKLKIMIEEKLKQK